MVSISLCPLLLITQSVCSWVSWGCERRNTGLTLFQYGLVQWWAYFDGCEGVTLVSGLQLFNLWRIISWRRLLLVALGGGESNRCCTKRHLFIHLAAVVAITAGKKRILFMHYNAMWNAIVDCKLYVAGLGIKTAFLCELCGFWNTLKYRVSLSQALYSISWTCHPIRLLHTQQRVWAWSVRLGSHLLPQSLCKVNSYMQTVNTTDPDLPKGLK